jgi:hypothetical protein
MIVYKVDIRFVHNGEYIGTDPYHVEVPDSTSEDDLMTALMDSAREILNAENDGNEAWENGEINWTIIDFESFKF